jgi:hypothetical protein
VANSVARFECYTLGHWGMVTIKRAKRKRQSHSPFGALNRKSELEDTAACNQVSTEFSYKHLDLTRLLQREFILV